MAQAPDEDVWERAIPVLDGQGRRRAVRVGVRSGQIVVLTPPGEGFTVSREDAYLAAAILQAAADRVVGHLP